MNNKDDEYEDSDALVSLVKQILALKQTELKDASKATFDVVFSRKLQRGTGMHKGGVTKKVEGAVRHRTGLEFTITIWLVDFLVMKPHDRVKTLVHELHHIGYDLKGKPKIREHSLEFCEILEHDVLSESIVTRIFERLIIPEFSNATRQNYTTIDGVRVYRK